MNSWIAAIAAAANAVSAGFSVFEFEHHVIRTVLLLTVGRPPGDDRDIILATGIECVLKQRLACSAR